jgi:CRISPR-associated protein Cmr4
MKTAILGLHAETSIHAGAGSALDVVDQPIQREAHNNWPCIFGSSVKGALRATANASKIQNIDAVFGPATATNDAYAGALLVGDARLLLLPVRSLTTHFKWITCPAALFRLKRDAERLGIKLEFDVPKMPEEMKALAAKEGEAFLEEYRFEVKQYDLSSIIQALASISDVAGIADALSNQLLILNDDDFSYLVKHAIPVTPHIALDSETKSVKNGALWYEETLPPETLLYVCLAAQDGRSKETKLPADAVLQSVVDMFKAKPYLQIGGNETVGMGWCKIKVEG